MKICPTNKDGVLLKKRSGRARGSNPGYLLGPQRH
jgi:hypothetical protein